MYYLFFWAARIVPRLPRWFLRRLPDIIGLLAWLFSVSARRQAMDNAVRVMGLEMRSTPAGRRRLRSVVRGMFRSSAGNYLEALLLPTVERSEMLRRVSVVGREYLEEALVLGRGVILFSAHVGPFEYVNQWFALNGYPVVIPVERLKDERMLRLMLELRSSSGAKFVPLGGSTPLRTIMQALRQKQVVLIMADRAVVGESVVRNFFGSPARLPLGPVNLSLRTGAPLVGAFSWRDSQGHIHGLFTRLTLALSEEERQQPDVVEGAVIKQIEQVVSAHPDQWVVFSPVWTESEAH
jgi:KDO2-lipid IV(A) lauroyltransferase